MAKSGSERVKGKNLGLYDLWLETLGLKGLKVRTMIMVLYDSRFET